MKKILSILILFICLVGAGNLSADTAASKYQEAARLVKKRQYDFAFLAFRSVVRDYPQSKYAQEALFALGEYYYFIKSYGEADKTFNEYISKYSDSRGAIFARVYLWKIIEHSDKVPERKKEALDKLTAYFFSKPLFLLFSEYKELSYLSPFENKLIIRHYVDKIEVYRNGQIFAQFTP